MQSVTDDETVSSSLDETLTQTDIRAAPNSTPNDPVAASSPTIPERLLARITSSPQDSPQTPSQDSPGCSPATQGTRSRHAHAASANTSSINDSAFMQDSPSSPSASLARDSTTFAGAGAAAPPDNSAIVARLALLEEALLAATSEAAHLTEEKKTLIARIGEVQQELHSAHARISDLEDDAATAALTPPAPDPNVARLSAEQAALAQQLVLAQQALLAAAQTESQLRGDISELQARAGLLQQKLDATDAARVAAVQEAETAAALLDSLRSCSVDLEQRLQQVLRCSSVFYFSMSITPFSLSTSSRCPVLMCFLFCRPSSRSRRPNSSAMPTARVCSSCSSG